MRCYRCKQDLQFEDFAVDRSKASGHKSVCKRCDRERARGYYAANADRIRPVARNRARLKAASTHVNPNDPNGCVQ